MNSYTERLKRIERKLETPRICTEHKELMQGVNEIPNLRNSIDRFCSIISNMKTQIYLNKEDLIVLKTQKRGLFILVASISSTISAILVGVVLLVFTQIWDKMLK